MTVVERAEAPAGTPVHAAARTLRAAFWCALVVAMVVTHWPKLRAGTPEQPIDKLAHASAYAVLMALACLAYPRAPRWRTAIALAALGVLDELGQSIPAVGRSADVDDWLADSAGILISWAFVAAARPIRGSGAAALLDRRRSTAAAVLLARPANCLHLATAAVLGALVGAPLAVFVDSIFVRKGPQPWQYGFIGAALGAGVAAHALFEAGLRWRMRRAERDHPCLSCGSTGPADSPCGACGRPRTPMDWAPVGLLPGKVELRACAAPILLALAGLIVVSTSSIALVAMLRLRVEQVESFDQWYRSRAPDFRLLTDLTMVALLGAWALGQCRSRIAAAVDRCGQECLACGFDLRATLPAAGTGSCHECGAPFVRTDPGVPPPGPPGVPAA